MKATPKQDLPFALSKKDRMADGTPRGLWVSHSPFSWAAFGEGTGPFEVVWRSRYGTNTKFLREVIGPISASNDIELKYSIMLFTYAGAAETMLYHGPHGKNLL